MIDARARRAVPDGPLEAFHRLGVAFGEGFDAAAGKVADPAVNPLARGDGFAKNIEIRRPARGR